MNKLSIILTFTALTGCATFHDPAASVGEVNECKVLAHDDAHDNTSWSEVLLFGAPIAHRLKARESFKKCMAAKGYRTTAQG